MTGLPFFLLATLLAVSGCASRPAYEPLYGISDVPAARTPATAMPSYGSAAMGTKERTYNVKNCNVLIPSFGEQDSTIMDQLRSHGFNPIVTDKLQNVRRANILVYDISTLDSLDHNDPEIMGTPYIFIKGWVAKLGTSSQISLILSVVGESGANLFESDKYTLLPGLFSSVFSANKFPSCRTP